MTVLASNTIPKFRSIRQSPNVRTKTILAHVGKCIIRRTTLAVCCLSMSYISGPANIYSLCLRLPSFTFCPLRPLGAGEAIIYPRTHIPTRTTVKRLSAHPRANRSFVDPTGTIRQSKANKVVIPGWGVLPLPRHRQRGLYKYFTGFLPRFCRDFGPCKLLEQPQKLPYSR